MNTTNPRYESEARHAWSKARRKARQVKFEHISPGESNELLDFNTISSRLHLRHALYRGVQNVSLDQIVGSLGRYKDFTNAFLPADDGLSGRWQRIAMIYLDPTSGGVPPIELYKVGASYFVKDGNHRVSVARQLDLVDIEAYVWEYPEPVAGLDGNTDIDTLLLESERREFLNTTELDALRPGHNIRLTAPGGYMDMLQQIINYQQALAHIDGEDVPWETAVTAWYDMLYETTLTVIENTGVLELFPDRTVADFYVWIKAHHAQLQDHYGRRIMLDDAARDFGKRNRNSLPSRTWRAVARWIVGYLDLD
jgi:hypothetical protein